MTVLRIILAATLAWAIAALVAQVLRAWGGGRRDYSQPRGSRVRGAVYSLTTAMLPARKEAIRLHPVEFGIGLVMHAGVAAALVGVVTLALRPITGANVLAVLQPVSGAALVAAVVLLVRRTRVPDLRAMSVPDDYLAIGVTAGLLAAAMLAPLGGVAPAALLIYASLFLLYVPLGKLRHVVFFFVARGEYGRRLGHRGVYPPAPHTPHTAPAAPPAAGLEPGR